MRKVAIIGVGMGSRWGKYTGTLIEMMAEASLSAIDDAGTDEIDAVWELGESIIKLHWVQH